MKINFLIPTLTALLLGYLCANYVINEYDSNLTKETKTAYFLQISANKNKDNNEYRDIKNKITLKEDDMYYTYIGITTLLDEANRIKKMYKDNGIDVYIKKKNLDNNNFILSLEQYDILLKSSESRKEIDNVLASILSSFEENYNNM